MRFALGADHAGVTLKSLLSSWLTEHGHEVIDLGTTETSSVDYPDFAHQVAERVSNGQAERGLLVCGTGVGMAMSANRHRNVRAVNCTDLYTVRMARAHNDANVLCLGARVVGSGLAEALLQAFLEGPFEGGRHADRIAKIEDDPES